MLSEDSDQLSHSHSLIRFYWTLLDSQESKIILKQTAKSLSDCALSGLSSLGSYF